MDDHPMVTTLVVWRLTSQAQRRAVVGRWCLSGNQTWHSQLHLTWLVGGWPTPLKNMSSSVGMILPNIWKNKKCSKPPISQVPGSRARHHDFCLSPIAILVVVAISGGGSWNTSGYRRLPVSDEHYGKTLWFARKVRMEFKYYPSNARKPAQGQCFGIYQTLNPKTLKPWKLWIRKEKTLRIRGLFCQFLFSCSTVRESKRCCSPGHGVCA